VKSASELNVTGAEFQLEGNWEAARLHYLAALGIDPNNWHAMWNLMCALGQDDSKLETAASWGFKLVKLVPGHAASFYNLGNILTRLHRMDEAEIFLSRARELAPDDPVSWYNSAVNAYKSRHTAQALVWMDEAIKLNPTNLGQQNDRAFFLLDLGKIKSGLEAYEARWNMLVHLDPWDLHVPEWQGETLAGKHLLLHSEQGFGDCIMLSRFVPALRQKCSRLTFAVPRTMVELFEAQGWDVEIKGTTEVCEEDQYDFHSPMFSAWRWLGTDLTEIPNNPYLRGTSTDSDDRRIIGHYDRDLGKVASQRELNVGIVWASGRYGGVTGALRRVIPLEFFLPLGTVPGVRLHSLQMGGDEADLERLATDGLILDPTPSFKNWLATANYIDRKIDLVICCETGLAHLVGALGKPCWMMSPYRNCWRWWDIDINKSGWPWYKNMCLFRQAVPIGWEQTMKEVLKALEGYAGGMRQELDRAA
jgi:hypothetical protein